MRLVELSSLNRLGRPRFIGLRPGQRERQVHAYYFAILAVSLANLVLAGIAYAQRAKQIRGNRVREQQLALAEARNRLAESRLRRLDDQLAVLNEIRDAVCGSGARLSA